MDKGTGDISVALARDLKDAGFPQEVIDGEILYGEGEESYYAPIEEEIADCFDEVSEGPRDVPILRDTDGMKFVSFRGHTETGVTYREAYARLYIRIFGGDSIPQPIRRENDYDRDMHKFDVAFWLIVAFVVIGLLFAVFTS